jgi:hypothetical protein
VRGASWRSAFRRDERSPVVRHKSLSYQLNVLALAEGRKSGADEVYFLNAAGRLTEGAITNLFFARGGRAFTPDVAGDYQLQVTSGSGLTAIYPYAWTVVSAPAGSLSLQEPPEEPPVQPSATLLMPALMSRAMGA